MTHEELIEALAVEICHNGSGELVFDVWSPDMQEAFRRQARAAAAFIAQALKEPNERIDAFDIGDEHSADSIFSAMLAASPLYPDKPGHSGGR